jgi:hypothetical protein
VIRLIEVATTGRDPVVVAETGDRGSVPAARRDVATRARGQAGRPNNPTGAAKQLAAVETLFTPEVQMNAGTGCPGARARLPVGRQGRDWRLGLATWPTRERPGHGTLAA